MMVRSLLVNYFRFYCKCLNAHLCLATGIPTYYLRQETHQSKERLWHTFLVPFVLKMSDTCLGNDQTKEHQQYVPICCAMLLYYSIWRRSYGWSGFVWCTHGTCIRHVLNESLVFIIHLTRKSNLVFAQNLIAFPCDIKWKRSYVHAICSKPQENIWSTQCLDILAHLTDWCSLQKNGACKYLTKAYSRPSAVSTKICLGDPDANYSHLCSGSVMCSIFTHSFAL